MSATNPRTGHDMIELTNFTVNFGPVRAVDGLTVAFEDRITGLIGPNGAGKTTLLGAVAGQIPASGQVRVDGIDITDMEGFARGRFGVRRTFQTDQVVLGLSVFDNVAVGGDASGDSPDQARTLMEIVDLSVDDGRSAASLTTLERRKVEFARALMGSPRVVLMDEPGAGLSSEEKAELERAIHSASDQLNTPVVLVEHDIDLVSRVCSGCVVLNFGTLIAQGPTADVLARSVVKAAYLGTVEDAAS